MSRPLVSIIVIIFDMPRQALNTLRSLTLPYQQGVDEPLFEIVVVENRSPRIVDPAAVATLPPNVRYFLRDEAGSSPAAAINFGIEQARGEMLCLMIDGARMVTPGIIQCGAMACRVTPDALVIVPGYHLGKHQQHLSREVGYTEETEQALLAGIAWPVDGYRLFEIACYSESNRHGIFHPFTETNCLFVSRRHLERIGGADERFQLAGGGALNLYLYRRLALLPETVLFMLPGEGSFHQLHGGVTTSTVGDRQHRLKRLNDELSDLLGEPFRSPRIAPILLGKVGGAAFDFLELSCERGRERERRFVSMGTSPFVDEEAKRQFRNGGFAISSDSR
jgi:glycosyltransferase involved in cell wall biosynthesis